MRRPGEGLAVYTDYRYHRAGGQVFSERAFSLFIASLAEKVGGLKLIGRLDPSGSRARYPIGAAVDFVPLPHYESLAKLGPALRSMAASVRQLWRGLDNVSCVWALGPHPLALALAVMAWVRRRRVVLGVRQDLPLYVRSRHPSRRLLRISARLLEWGFRTLGRICPVIVVGPDLARNYARSTAVLEISVSLVTERQILPQRAVTERDYGGDLTLLSVGRLDAEKNPMMLADVLALLRGRDPRWRLVACGEGPMREGLLERLDELGLRAHAELPGYVAIDGGLAELYRGSHVFLNVSWTEGVPQVLFEAFAAALPVVATDVGGIREAVGNAVRLVPVGDPAAAVTEVTRIAEDTEERERLVREGHELVSSATLDSVTDQVAAFLKDLPGGTRPNGRKSERS